MEKEKEDRFRKLIQKTGPDKTSPDFTGMLMKNIQMETEQALERAAVLETILTKLQPETPSPLFRKTIMTQIALAEKKAEQPIVSRKVWYLVAATAVLIIGFCVLGQSDTAVEGAPNFFVKIDQELFKLQEGMMVLPMIYPAVVFALSTLIMADYFVRQRVVRN
ncbi:hypothetical protein [Dyadobacter sp. LHD-138]|uniref:hypothetical protein n=1 Tax=Dyadobacter sp. LHD-138 TaxID=3071413 RepID=UPI0027E1832B|nr:hypothetical protein [Dyadobacter sp. LHD-138]MDQ6477899.1 hypothetical protein [Dyadobacter sp. LHD-138]